MTTETMLLMIRVTAICLFAYFGTANSVIKGIEMFTFYIPFSKKMVQNGVYSQDDHKHLITGRWVPLIAIFVLSTGLAAWLSFNSMPIGPIAAVLCFAAGLLSYHRVLRDKKLTMQKFVIQYRDFMNKEKFQEALKKDYGLTLEEISAYKRT